MKGSSMLELARFLGRLVGEVERAWLQLQKDQKANATKPEDSRKRVLEIARELGIDVKDKTDKEIDEQILQALEKKYGGTGWRQPDNRQPS